MALEENVVERNVFNANSFGVAGDFQDAVDQKHGIAVGKDALDPANVHLGGRRNNNQKMGVVFLVEELFGQQMVEGMSALAGDDAAADGTADEEQVADQVEDFMADAFIGEAELVVDRAGGGDDQKLLGSEMLAEAAGAEVAGFFFEDEGARGGELGNKVVVAQVEAEDLAADGGLGLEVVNDFQAIGGAGQGSEGCAVGGHLDWLADDQGADHLVLLDNSRFLNDFDEGPAAAVAGGQLADRAAGDFDDGVVDAHAGQSRHAVFDGFDEEGAVLEAGSTGPAGDVENGGGDGGDFAVLFADEGDAGIGLGGREGERGGLSGEEAQAAEGGFL